MAGEDDEFVDEPMPPAMMSKTRDMLANEDGVSQGGLGRADQVRGLVRDVMIFSQTQNGINDDSLLRSLPFSPCSLLPTLKLPRKHLAFTPAFLLSFSLTQ